MGNVGALSSALFDIRGGQNYAVTRHQVSGLQFFHAGTKQDVTRCEKQKFPVADRETAAAADDLVNIPLALGHITDRLTVKFCGTLLAECATVRVFWFEKFSE